MPVLLLFCTADTKQKPGEAMLEQYRKSGKPIPPQVEKMAAWLDSMEQDAGQDVPMVKPGVIGVEVIQAQCYVECVCLVTVGEQSRSVCSHMPGWTVWRRRQDRMCPWSSQVGVSIECSVV